LAAEPINRALFGQADYVNVVRALAFIQMGIAYANLSVALLKGYRDALGNAVSVVLGSLMGVLTFMVSFTLKGYEGALIGLALMPAIVLLPAIFLLWRRKPLPLHYLKLRWDKTVASHFGKFTMMALITSVTLPVAYIMMRHQMAQYYDWDEVGIWQAVTSISDAYLQFITASFTVYLLPTLARLQQKSAISEEIVRALKFALPIVGAVSFGVWLLRDVAIWLLFSPKFIAMRDLFAWQLVGDILKVGAYVFGYLVIAKASLRFYILGEISQFSLLMLFSHWLIPLRGALGATQAYMATYVLYFALCSGVFILYRRCL
jgi:antigen flippase